MPEYPTGICNCISLWFDRPQEPSALAVVREALATVGGMRRQLGPLGVNYYGSASEHVPADRRPVRIDYQNPYDGPVEVLSRAEQKRLVTLERAGGKLMRVLCDALDPAYAIHGGDADRSPLPGELRSGFETLGNDFYVSRRLVPELGLPGGKTEDWTHGTHVFTAIPYDEAVAEFSRSVGRALIRPRRL